MGNLEIDKEYIYDDVLDFAREEDYDVNELGEEIVGENFIVLKHNYSDKVISLIHTGSTGKGYVYKVVYKD